MERIKGLYQFNDSIRNSIDTVYIDTLVIEKGRDTISQNEILNQIGTMHTMYSDNFSNLVIIVSIIAGIIGIFLPVLLLIIQNRNNKKEIDLLKGEFKLEIESEYKEYFEEKFKDDVQKIENLINYNYHFTQSITMINLNQFNDVWENTLMSIIFALKLKDHKKIENNKKNIGVYITRSYPFTSKSKKIKGKYSYDEYKNIIIDLCENDDYLTNIINETIELIDSAIV